MIKTRKEKMLEARLDRLERLLAKNETVTRYAGESPWGDSEYTHIDYDPEQNVKQAFKAFASDENNITHLCSDLGRAAYYNKELAQLIGKALMRCPDDELKTILATTRVSQRHSHSCDEIEVAGLYWPDFAL